MEECFFGWDGVNESISIRWMFLFFTRSERWISNFLLLLDWIFVLSRSIVHNILDILAHGKKDAVVGVVDDILDVIDGTSSFRCFELLKARKTVVSEAIVQWHKRSKRVVATDIRCKKRCEIRFIVDFQSFLRYSINADKGSSVVALSKTVFSLLTLYLFLQCSAYSYLFHILRTNLTSSAHPMDSQALSWKIITAHRIEHGSVHYLIERKFSRGSDWDR